MKYGFQQSCWDLQRKIYFYSKATKKRKTFYKHYAMRLNGLLLFAGRAFSIWVLSFIWEGKKDILSSCHWKIFQRPMVIVDLICFACKLVFNEWMNMNWTVYRIKRENRDFETKNIDFLNFKFKFFIQQFCVNFKELNFFANLMISNFLLENGIVSVVLENFHNLKLFGKYILLFSCVFFVLGFFF